MNWFSDLGHVALAVTIVALLLTAYIYVGYPILIRVLAILFRRSVNKERNALTVSVIIAAANEEQTLPEKIKNVLACRGAQRIRELVIVSDGSTDGTVAAVEAIDDSRIHIIELEQRRGKPHAINTAVPYCSGDLLVLMDARQTLDIGAIEALTENFSDPAVGGVSGELTFVMRNSTTSAEGVGVYWAYEKFIRKSEAEFRSVPGATGALYAIRRELFQPIPEETILDDVLIPMQAVVAGTRCVFESRAIAYDRPTTDPRAEATRKRRTIAGAAQLLVLRPSLLLPWRNPIWLEFVSHKVLRLASPFCLLVALFGSIVATLSNTGLLRLTSGVLLGLQLLGYAGAVWGAVLQRFGKRDTLGGVCLMFWTLNLTTLFAIWDALRGRFRVTWTQVRTSTPDITEPALTGNPD